MPDVTRESGVSVGYSTVLDKSLFEAQREDEIILCLNYVGAVLGRHGQGAGPPSKRCMMFFSGWRCYHAGRGRGSPWSSPFRCDLAEAALEQRVR